MEELNLTIEQLIIDMKNCEQTKGQSIYEHGIPVNEYFNDLYNHLKLNTELKFEWKLPSWIYEHKEFILEKLFDLQTIKDYQIFHDCGKPYCKTIDECGKVHFYNHAKFSGIIWRKVSNNEQVAKLIESDMDIHLLKSENLIEFSKRNEAITLLVTGLCEIHSNSKLFGGISSTSFKIKYKHIEKRGKQIINQIL